MISLPLAFSWQNVVDGNGVPLALTGLAIVFSGLLIIALFIGSLPRMLATWDRFWAGRDQATTAKPTAASKTVADPSTASPEVQAALAWVAIRELEVFRLGDEQRLTLQPHRRPGTWRVISILRENESSD